MKSGAIDLSNGTVKGNVSLGSGVAAPPAPQVTGMIAANYAGGFSMPEYPTAASVSKSYSLGATIPAQLPVNGHQPAADGRYSYFVSGATIGVTSLATGKIVTCVGTTTSLRVGLTINCAGAVIIIIIIDGAINASTQNALNNGNWADALQIFSPDVRRLRDQRQRRASREPVCAQCDVESLRRRLKRLRGGLVCGQDGEHNRTDEFSL